MIWTAFAEATFEAYQLLRFPDSERHQARAAKHIQGTPGAGIRFMQNTLLDGSSGKTTLEFFPAPAGASGFEMLNSFQASQNTTCSCPATTF